jgi:hypothetical protein
MELTVRQFAERLHVTPGRVHQLISEGQIKPGRYLSARFMLIDDSELAKVKDRPKAGRPFKKQTHKAGRKVSR